MESDPQMTLAAKVGMFWCVGKTVVGEAVPLDEAEPYDNA